MFNDPLNTINVWGCITVFIGVVMYKIQYHFIKVVPEQARVEGDGEPSPKRYGVLKYRQIKDHFSDDEGELMDRDVHDLEEFLDEDDDTKALSEVELPVPHKRTYSSNSSAGDDSV